MTDTTATPIDPSNTDQARAWDGDEGAYWAEQAARFDASVARYHGRLLEVADLSPTARVLDIGCGTGQVARDAARIATDGSALGVDLSSRMIEVARAAASQEGVANVRFQQADAQIHPFAPQTFDLAMSRTGSMFFGDPIAAFTNIGRALRPGGRLVLMVWQPMDRNEWIVAISTAMAAGRDLPAPPPGAPGPFSMSDPDRVRGLLTAAGFTEPAFEGQSEPMLFGRDAVDAVRFVVGLSGWMLEGLDDEGRARALDALRAVMTSHESTDGVTFRSATWLITASRQ